MATSSFVSLRVLVRSATGLGLAITRDLARAQGGDVWYEQAATGGACFCLSMPRAGDEEPARVELGANG